MPYIKLQASLFLIPTVALLAACGGGDLTNSERATALINAADNAQDFIDAEGGLPALVAELPTDAPVQYSGALGVAGGEGTLEEGPVLVAYLGELDLTADFDTGDISGTATNFIDIENPSDFIDFDADPVAGGDVTGTLVIAGIPDDDVTAFFSITVDGDLTADNSNLGFDSMSGELAVFGANAEVVALEGGSDDGIIFNDVPGWLGYAGLASQ